MSPTPQEREYHETDWPARREAYITRIEVLLEVLAKAIRGTEEVREIREEVGVLKTETALLRQKSKTAFRWTIGLMIVISILMWIATLTLIFLRT